MLTDRRHDKTILVIEDDPDSLDFLLTLLTCYEFNVLTATGGIEGVEMAMQHLPHLIILDIMLPDMDGFQVCNALRKNPQTQFIPIIILSARDQIHDKVFGFELGADDYVTKPVHEEELIARIKSKLRRAEDTVYKSFVITRGPLKIDIYSQRVFIHDAEVQLTTLELELLKFLVEKEGMVLSRERILNKVWEDSNVHDRTVDAHIYSLRKKHKYLAQQIETVYGGGYRFRSGSTK